jgi:opacity protein-like surface antigen
MRLAQYFVAGALALALPTSALAQTTAQPQTAAPVTYGYGGSEYGPWLASGFVGSTFNQNSDTNLNIVDESSLTFGGQIAYLWAGKIGAEFLADFSPGFKVNTLLLADDPNMSSYMANVIAVAPFGYGKHIQPFVSGGLGAVRLSADVLNNPLLINSDTTSGHDTRWGANVGGGLMAFANTVGFRADIRWFRTATDEHLTSNVVDQIAGSFIDDLSFWRANVGVAFRW